MNELSSNYMFFEIAGTTVNIHHSKIWRSYQDLCSPSDGRVHKYPVGQQALGIIEVVKYIADTIIIYGNAIVENSNIKKLVVKGNVIVRGSYICSIEASGSIFADSSRVYDSMQAGENIFYRKKTYTSENTTSAPYPEIKAKNVYMYSIDRLGQYAIEQETSIPPKSLSSYDIQAVTKNVSERIFS